MAAKKEAFGGKQAAPFGSKKEEPKKATPKKQTKAKK